jgi:radical SAM protein with 4Fe4S-binding SPASM domain
MIIKEGFCDCCGAARNGNCLPGYRLYLSADGTYYPCKRIPHVKKFEIGNVNDGIDVNKVMHILYTDYLKTKDSCQSCWAIRFCDLCYGKTLMTDDLKALCQECRDYHETSIQHNLEMFENQLFDFKKLA